MPDVFQVILQQTYNGESAQNVFSYVVEDKTQLTGDVASSRLLNAMGFVAVPASGIFSGLTLAGLIQEMQNTGVTFDSVYAYDQYDPDDFTERAFAPGVFGIATGDYNSSVLAYGFRSDRLSRAIRRSTKRFTGVADEAIEPNNAITAPRLAVMNAVAGAMSETLTLTDAAMQTTTARPATFKKDKYTTPSGGTAYRFFPTKEEQLENSVSPLTWSPYTTVRSQVSRQTGRGI